MIYPGLVSITFRELSPAEIIGLAVKAGIKGIEWGGDVHVPHGDIKTAKEVLKMTKEANLTVAAYGSYYRIGCEQEKGLKFEQVLESAIELESPVIRVWAGDRGSADADEKWWSRVIDESRRIGDLSAEHNIKIAYEYHKNTLTDSIDSVERLLKQVNHHNIECYWQPLNELDKNQKVKGLKKLIPYLSNIHVFHWDSNYRYTLEEGMKDWTTYLDIIKEAKGNHYAMLEYVKDNTLEQFLKDADTLKRLLSKI